MHKKRLRRTSAIYKKEQLFNIRYTTYGQLTAAQTGTTLTVDMIRTAMNRIIYES